MSTDYEQSLARLRAALRYHKQWEHLDDMFECDPDLLNELIAERDALKADNAKLRTVMVAAAEEIQAHWEAHCDAEGYGPANLMHRLEEGIPSEYSYTAGAFAALKADAERMREAAGARFEAATEWLRNNYQDHATIDEVCEAMIAAMKPQGSD